MSLFFIDLEKETDKRFDMSKFMSLEGDAYDPLTSDMLSSIRKLPVSGEIVVRGETGRPDQLAFRAFGDTQFWWIIMLFNDLIDVNDVTEGRKFSLPSQSALDDLFFSLKAKQTASGG